MRGVVDFGPGGLVRCVCHKEKFPNLVGDVGRSHKPQVSIAISTVS